MHWTYVKVGAADCNVGWGLAMCRELTENSSTFTVNQWIHKSVSPQRHLHWKNTNTVFIVTLETG